MIVLKRFASNKSNKKNQILIIYKKV